jgi:hypothetical protein
VMSRCSRTSGSCDAASSSGAVRGDGSSNKASCRMADRPTSQRVVREHGTVYAFLVMVIGPLACQHSCLTSCRLERCGAAGVHVTLSGGHSQPRDLG